MPYADKEKQKTYMRDWSRNYQRRKNARLKELEVRFQKQTQEQTKTIEDAFKPKLLPDPRDERIGELEQENRKLRERCRFQDLLLVNYERRKAVLETLLTNSSLARKR